MKTHVYRRLAADGIRKNKRLYVPYMMTGSIMVMMHYLMCFLVDAPVMERVRGSGFLTSILGLGAIVIRLFAALFLFYTNSFLIRQRNREFGLYNVLGMDKKNIARIIVWESVLSTLVSVCGGLLLGMLFSKLGEIGLLNIVGLDTDYEISVSLGAVRLTVRIFAEIYLFLMICSILRVWFLKPLDLLQSSQVGEKPPRARWLLTLAGLISLGIAYFLAVMIQEPIEALMLFFVAVVLVIAATYVLFVVGSVTLCRVLQKNKRYYYRANHFVSVSSMAYRMRRNGEGLASICILSTMVLVMLSCTVTLYTGDETHIRNSWPRQIVVEIHSDSLEGLDEEHIEAYREAVTGGNVPAGADAAQPVPVHTNVISYRKAEAYAVYVDDVFAVDMEHIPDLTAAQAYGGRTVQFFSLEDFNTCMGTEAVLEDGECLIYCVGTDYRQDTITFAEGKTYCVKAVLDRFIEDGLSVAISGSTIINVVVADLDACIAPLSGLISSRGLPWIDLYWVYGCDMENGEDLETAEAEVSRILENVSALRRTPGSGITRTDIQSRAANRADVKQLNGGLLFLGLLLSLVFIFASVLIIYYKQISEGYEDQSRFGIMQNVGMTKREIRRSVNSQILTVFFLPLVFAGVHLAFAFPMLWRIMMMMGSVSLPLFAGMTVLCFAVFGVFYAAVYKLTAGAYYRIVSGARE